MLAAFFALKIPFLAEDVNLSEVLSALEAEINAVGPSVPLLSDLQVLHEELGFPPGQV